MLRSVIDVHPEHAQAQYQMGKVLLDQGQMDEAVKHLEAAAKLDPYQRLHSLPAANGLSQNWPRG